jgi:copper chaperone
MDRRNFLCEVAAVGTAAASVAAAKPAAVKETRAVTWKVKGFTCITCSVGLEVMLRGLHGVARANASYPANNVVIGFDEHATSEKTLREFIEVCGFTLV